MLVETISAIGSAVTGAIRQAAQATGTGFSYLLATAKIESGLNPQVKSPTSSATGLFQFIDQTWLMTMKQSGAALGYGRYADAIERTASGRYFVRDPAMRAEILNLRKDPTANAAMAGALTQQNAARLKSKIGRDPTAGELYIAHFLGSGGASKLINAAGKNPNVKAAALFPRAAAANRSIFYDKQGSARSVTGVYSTLTTKLARAMPVQTPTQVAQAPIAPQTKASVAARSAAPVQALAAIKSAVPIQAPAPIQSVSAPQQLLSPTRMAAVAPTIPMPPLAQSVAPLMFSQSQMKTVAALTPAPAAPPPAPVAMAAGNQSVFYDLFSSDGRGAVSRVVSDLWGIRAANAAPASSAVTPPTAIGPASAADQGPARGLHPSRAVRPKS